MNNFTKKSNESNASNTLKIFKILGILGTLLLSSSNAKELNLNISQIDEIQKIYDIGKSITASDGTTFGYSLISIYGTESSFGVNIIGDKYFKNGREKPLYLKSLSGFQIKVSTAIETIENNSELYDYLELIDGKRSPLLVEKLLRDYEFSAEIGGYFLKGLYERALMRNYHSPWKKAIRKYNGGWKNTVYYPKIIKNMKKIKKCSLLALS